MAKSDDHPFTGFRPPSSNWFRLPNEWTDITAGMLTWAEQKVVEYVLRHTWGYQEYGIMRRITLDEFMNGRRRVDGGRMDLGTGMGKKAIIDGIRAAVAQGFLIEEVDDGDRARVKKFYSLRMAPIIEGFDADTSDVRSSNPGVRSPNSRGSFSEQRSEKETLERNFIERQQQSVVVKAQQYEIQKNLPMPWATNDPFPITTALTMAGLTEKLAERYTTNYPEEYLTAKLELVAWLTETKSPLLTKNPAGYLRRAIEEDYQPPKNFKPAAEREAELLAKEQRQRDLQATVERITRQVPEAPQMPVNKRTTGALTKSLSSADATVLAAWERAKEELQKPGNLSQANYVMLIKPSLLVRVEGETAVIAVPNNFIRQTLESRMASTVRKVLTNVFGHPVTPEFVVAEDLRVASEEASPGPAKRRGRPPKSQPSSAPPG